MGIGLYFKPFWLEVCIDKRRLLISPDWTISSGFIGTKSESRNDETKIAQAIRSKKTYTLSLFALIKSVIK